jgi:hypothetical protein
MKATFNCCFQAPSLFKMYLSKAKERSSDHLTCKNTIAEYVAAIFWEVSSLSCLDVSTSFALSASKHWSFRRSKKARSATSFALTKTVESISTTGTSGIWVFARLTEIVTRLYQSRTRLQKWTMLVGVQSRDVGPSPTSIVKTILAGANTATPTSASIAKSMSILSKDAWSTESTSWTSSKLWQRG